MQIHQFIEQVESLPREYKASLYMEELRFTVSEINYPLCPLEAVSHHALGEISCQGTNLGLSWEDTSKIIDAADFETDTSETQLREQLKRAMGL